MRRRTATAKRILRKVTRPAVRFVRRRQNRPAVILCVVVFALGVMAVYKNMPTHIDPAAYTPLLNTIAKGESGGNYNAYYGNAGNTAVQFTNMTVGQVLQWQKHYVASGSISSAVGRYQIIRPTLLGLVSQLHLNLGAKFDAALQDKLAITLAERRGSVAYVDKKITQQQFAANLAKEWASLPRMTGPNPAQSYYAGDGVNAARVNVGAVERAVERLKD